MKWLEFGNALMEARLAAGFAQQAEFASALGISQQTVSRWERGSSRPRPAQIPAIAAVAKIEVEELLMAAGYAPVSVPQLSIDHPWPLDALAPETFERFCVDLTTLLHGADAVVSLYGKQGHTQSGIDISANHQDGTRTTYQCKRHDSFGPKKILTAVEAHTLPAERKIILLSSVASPQAREEIKKHSAWQLWDREDITRKARLELSWHDQLRLVDTYFVGQRMALLNEAEASPWQTRDEYFEGMTRPARGFSHAWTLRGRESELRKLIDFSADPDQKALLLVGNGGIGKSRLLKALADHMIGKSKRRLFFLGREPLKAKDLEALGRKSKLLVCDDAHDREDLGLLADYVANPTNQAKLLLCLRTYGVQSVLRQTRSLGLVDMDRIELRRLSKSDSEELAKEALASFNAPSHFAMRLSLYTQDCPLATVLGAQILANERALPEFLLDEDAFRNELLRRLVQSTVEGASSGLNADSVRLTLAAVAVLQPIKEDDRLLLDAIGQIVGLAAHEVARILKRLREAGILFQRGAASRIAPDLLGDFLVEEQCITATGASSGFAAKVFDAAQDAYAENILVNLGRLDWRKSSGATSQSHLLDELWSRLKWHDQYSNPHLRAAAATAYYQPRQALAFVRRMLGDGHADSLLADAVRHASYNEDYLAEACQLLWDMGRNDGRAMNQEPSHGIRVLKELASPEPFKSLEFSDQVVDFGLSLIPHQDSWQGLHDPLEFLAGALVTEGHTSSSSARAITMMPFVVERAQVAHIRKKIIDACIDLLSNTDTQRAVAAAKTLGEAVRGPHGLFGNQVDPFVAEHWDSEFLATLISIEQALATKDIEPVVLVTLATSTGWFAQYAEGGLRESARRILGQLRKDRTTRTTHLLMDGWGSLTGYFEDGEPEDRVQEMDDFCTELLESHESADELYRYIDEILRRVLLVSEVSPHILMGRLLFQSNDYPKVLLEQALAAGNHPSDRFAGAALAKLLQTQDQFGLTVIQKMVSNGDEGLVPIVAEAYSTYRPTHPYTSLDITALRQIVSSSQQGAQRNAAYAIRQVALTDPNLAVDLVVHADFGSSPQLARDYLLWLCDRRTVPFERITESQVESILAKLFHLPRIDDHWIVEFLRKALLHHPKHTLNFLIVRIEYARQREQTDWSYTAVPWASGARGGLGLMKHPDAPRWLRYVFDWALSKEEEDESVLVWFGHLIKTLCKPYDQSFVEFLRRWTENGGRNHAAIVIRILREAPNTFVFQHQEFVIEFLRTTRSYSPELLKPAISALYSSAVGGMRSGTPGEPFPRDIEMRDRASVVLTGLTRFDPAYVLYADIRKHALVDIEHQIQEGLVLDELDD